MSVTNISRDDARTLATWCVLILESVLRLQMHMLTVASECSLVPSLSEIRPAPNSFIALEQFSTSGSSSIEEASLAIRPVLVLNHAAVESQSYLITVIRAGQRGPVQVSVSRRPDRVNSWQKNIPYERIDSRSISDTKKPGTCFHPEPELKSRFGVRQWLA